MFAFGVLVGVGLLIPQQPDDVLARYELRGKPAAVTRADVALEMAVHLRRRDRGRKACEMIADSLLTRQEAERRKLMPTDAEVRGFWQKLQDQLIAAGRRPEEFAAVRNTDERQWLDDLAVQIAQERLVRKELGLGKDDTVSGDMMKLWLSEARKDVDIETDPARLPVGTALRVGGRSVPLIDLGMLLLRTSEDHERDFYIRQVVYLDRLEALGDEMSLQVSQADLDRAIEAKRELAKLDPRYSGITFEQMLEAEGLTVDSLRTSRVFRAHVLLDKIASIRYPDAALERMLVDDRTAVLADVGPRRRIGLILVRALEQPNSLVQRTFAEAEARLLKVRQRIQKDGFAATANIESEHAKSKREGGDVGWHRRSSKQLPEVIVTAAFTLEGDDVSPPIRVDEGLCLVKVLDREPMPDDQELLQRLRKLKADELSQSLLDDAKLVIGEGDTATPPGQGK